MYDRCFIFMVLLFSVSFMLKVSIRRGGEAREEQEEEEEEEEKRSGRETQRQRGEVGGALRQLLSDRRLPGQSRDDLGGSQRDSVAPLAAQTA